MIATPTIAAATMGTLAEMALEEDFSGATLAAVALGVVWLADGCVGGCWDCCAGLEAAALGENQKPSVRTLVAFRDGSFTRKKLLSTSGSCIPVSKLWYEVEVEQMDDFRMRIIKQRSLGFLDVLFDVLANGEVDIDFKFRSGVKKLRNNAFSSRSSLFFILQLLVRDYCFKKLCNSDKMVTMGKFRHRIWQR